MFKTKGFKKIIAVILSCMVIISMTVIAVSAASKTGTVGGTDVTADLNISGKTALATITTSGTTPNSCSISGTCRFYVPGSPQISVSFSGTNRASYTAPSTATSISASATFTVKTGTATWSDSISV